MAGDVKMEGEPETDVKVEKDEELKDKYKKGKASKP